MPEKLVAINFVVLIILTHFTLKYEQLTTLHKI